MEAFQESINQTLERLGTDPKEGLNPSMVKVNQEKYGSNSFTKKKGKSLFRKIFEAASEPMIIMLLVAAGITLGVNLLQYFNGGETDLIECVGIFVAIFLAVGVTVIMEGKSEKAFEALNAIKEDVQVKTLRNGVIKEISQKELVVGDIIEISSGDIIPIDGRILSSTGLKIDESSLTGESQSVKKDGDLFFSNPKTPIAERANMVYSGCFVTEGIGRVIATNVGDQTEFGNIAKELSETKKGCTPLQEKMNRLGKTITILGTSAAAIVFIIQLIIFISNGNFNLDTVSDAFITSIVLIVAAVPEGLPTIVAVSLSINIIKMAKENALVKKLIACETIGAINVLCSDKTGTLTENKMTVTDIFQNNTLIHPKNLDSLALINNFCINSTAHLSTKDNERLFVGNPTEAALILSYEKSTKENQMDAMLNYEEIRNKFQIDFMYPFSSETKKMTTIIKEKDCFKVYSKGSPEEILKQCRFIRLENSVETLTSETRKEIEQSLKNFQNQSKRILSFASKEYREEVNYETERGFIESDMIFDGYVAITDPLREDVPDAVKKCAQAGIDLKILTGDNKLTAKAIANELGILENDNEVIEAWEVEALTDKELMEKLSTIKVIARSTPTIKMRVVNALKSLGNIVAVTGDGINDAPAIKNADVGIAMGISGTEVSKEASDIVLLDDSFSTIVKSVQWGRGIYENFQRFIQFQLTVNLSSVVVVLTAILIGMKSPFTALQLLWINIIMDGPPALTLGLEPIREDLLLRKPIPRNANIVTKSMLGRIVANGLYISLIFLLQATTNFLSGSPSEQDSILFTMFVVMHLFNALNNRELTNKSIFVNLFKNKLMILVFGLTFCLQIIITQFGGVFYNTTPLNLILWLKIVGLGLSVVVVSELVKYLRRKF
ncbi:MAG: calcium-translocating P-type ATPase, PMCA-type [Eubacteriaceae bacterium]